MTRIENMAGQITLLSGKLRLVIMDLGLDHLPQRLILPYCAKYPGYSHGDPSSWDYLELRF